MKKCTLFFTTIFILVMLTLTACNQGTSLPSVVNYTVTFESNGGSAVTAQEVSEGNLITEPAVPIRTGYTFAGWYKDAGLTSIWNFATDTVSENTSIYAKWTLVTYSIIYNLNDGTNDTGNPASYTIETTTITLLEPARDGYVFDGWYDNSGLTGTAVTTIPQGSTGDIELWAKWLEGFAITYNLDEGTNNVENPISYTEESATITLQPAYRSGYTFDGWYDNSGFTGTTVITIPQGSTGDIELWAKWSIINYSITYHPNDGTNDPGNPTTYTVESTTLTIHPASRTGYTFDGWYINEYFIGVNITSVPLGFTGDIELWAKWTPLDYTITYNLSGGTNNVNNPDSYTIESSTITLQDPTRTDYVFDGWYDNSDFTGPEVTSIPQGSMGDIEVWARWIYDFDGTGVTKRELVSITGGTYTQTDGTTSFTHTVSDFSLGTYEVTYELWYTVFQWAINNGYYFQRTGREGRYGVDGAEPTTAKLEPVTRINSRDAIVWCNAYSEMSGLSPCYSYSSQIIKDSRDTNATACHYAVCDWSADGYRLPTEGEWQYAASNGGATPWFYASGSTSSYSNTVETCKVSWYNVNSGNTTHDVGTTDNPNALMLWDMSGNVFEWCWDWYGGYPTGAPRTDYRGPTSATNRCVRGGCFQSDALYLQVGYRLSTSEISANVDLGFRVARSN